jgi:two-component system sensor kinase FixL
MRSIEQQRELSWPKATVLSALYVSLYVLLDRVSLIHALQHTEISPWGPNVALMIAVVMRYGARVAPLTILAPGISQVVLRDAAPFGMAAIAAVVCAGCTYTAAALLLRHLQRKYSQPTVQWFAVLLGVIVSSALLNALLYSAVLVHNGDLSAESYFTAVRTDWAGDVNGIIILLPLVLILRAGEAGKLSEIRAHIGLLVLQTAVLGCVFLITFRNAWGISDPADQTPFYLLFLPIIWIALRWGAGVTAIALAALQIGIVAFVAKHNTPESFLSIQVLMVLLACTGWFLGISESENTRINVLMRSKDDELSGLNARMAVSELTSAIGHELNNPLAALVNYMRSASLILDSPNFDRASLQSVLAKAQGEATRSVNVVRKLRDFIRSGAMRRESLDPRQLATEAIAAMQVKMRTAGIIAVLVTEADLPLIAADSLQLSMVLQNLLANAYDAVYGSDQRRGKITVAVARRENEIMFSVEDSGPGIEGHLRDQIFRPVTSTKSTGMGLGLAICRSLVEANEGRIWLVRSDSGGTCIAFSIPLAMREEVNEVEV